MARATFPACADDGERGAFWRYLGIALAGHRGQFAAATTLAEIGHHLRKLAERYCGPASS